jgi:hypothetical protein
MQVRPVPAVAQSASTLQFGFGRLSTRHAPWSQYLPVPHEALSVHVATQ